MKRPLAYGASVVPLGLFFNQRTKFCAPTSLLDLGELPDWGELLLLAQDHKRDTAATHTKTWANFIGTSPPLFTVCRGWPTSEFSHVASNIRVAGGKENTFGQRSLNDMQIARFVPSKVNEKMRRAAPIPSYVRKGARVSEKEARHFPTFVSKHKSRSPH